MSYIRPFTVDHYLFVQVLSATPPFIIHRVIDLSESSFTFFRAFKNMNPEFLNNRLFTADLQVEADTLKALHLPSVPQFCEYSSVAGRSFLTYKYIWGKSLLQILRELKKHKKMLSDVHACHIANEICKCLNQTHSLRSDTFPHGVVHYNLSPRNIIISYSGRVHVVDFGHKGPVLTPENLDSFDFRNLSYLSPEQISRKDISYKSDLFTVGSIFYEMLTGSPPFMEKTPGKVINRISKCSFLPPSQVNPGVPPQLDDFLLRTLTAYTNDRFGCAGHMSDELSTYLRENHPGFDSIKMMSLMKALFNSEIVEDIKHFKTVADSAEPSARLLLKSIPKIMFDEISEERKRSGIDENGLSMGSFSFGSRAESRLQGGTAGTPVKAAKKGSPKIDPFEQESPSISYTIEEFAKTRFSIPPKRSSFFEDEDTVFVDNTFSPNIVLIQPEKARLESGEFRSDFEEKKPKRRTEILDFSVVTAIPAELRTAAQSQKAMGANQPKTDVRNKAVLEPTVPSLNRTEAGSKDKTQVKMPNGKNYDAVEILNESDFRNQMIGRVLGEYTVTGILGWGGMGTVYDGIQPTIGKEVAIKVLNPKLCNDLQMTKRFLAEAKAVNSIRNPHIIDIFAFGILEEKYPYFVMEKLNGMSLGNYLQSHRTVTYDVAHEILLQVFNAIQAAHEKGIIHRDLKPDNIFLEKRALFENYVKVLDFGIAKFVSTTLKSGVSNVGTPMGTPDYMSPEHCLNDGICNSSDIYSLGIILYEMFTGTFPFRKNSYFETLLAHLREEPIKPSTVVPMDAALENIILWTLSKDPKKRPASVKELGDNLLPYLKERL